MFSFLAALDDASGEDTTTFGWSSTSTSGDAGANADCEIDVWFGSWISTIIVGDEWVMRASAMASREHVAKS